MNGGFSLTDPGQSSVLVAAANWVRTLITGTPATIISTLAIAGVGFLMLQGRLPLRRGLVAVLGCFVIFGAASIADALMDLAHGEVAQDDVAFVSPAVDTPAPAPMTPPPQPEVYDPYAGASVPVR